MGCSCYPDGVFLITRPCFFTNCLFDDCFLRALSHRHGPVGPSLQGMPEKLDFDVFVDFFTQNMKMVDQHGWILEFRAENDTKLSA